MSASSFTDNIGHAPVLQILEKLASLSSGGFLLYGPEHVGKRLVAEQFAHLLLDHPRDTSLSAHPDFIRLERADEARDIGVKQARAFLERMSFTSARGGKKVACVFDAETLSEEAANALLKAVEEPAHGSIYLFVTHAPDRLPAPLRSRLIHIPFERVSAQEMHDAFLARGMSEQDAVAYAEHARGCPGIVLSPHLSTEESPHIRSLVQAPVGVQCAFIEELAKRTESREDVEEAWRHQLRMAMAELDPIFREHPQEAVRIAHGLLHAWRCVGSPIAPRFALEWASVYNFGESLFASHPSSPLLSSYL